MSVKALKDGCVHLNYDGWFIYGEVNADVVSWYYVRDSSGPDGLKLINRQVDSKRYRPSSRAQKFFGKCLLDRPTLLGQNFWTSLYP